MSGLVKTAVVLVGLGVSCTAQSPTNATATTPTCQSMEGCLRDDNCVECLTRLRPVSTFLNNVIGDGTRELEFYQILTSPVCARTAPNASVISALLEAHTTPQCATLGNLSGFDGCQVFETQCAADLTCRACLSDVYTASGDYRALLARPPCSVVNRTLMDSVVVGGDSFIGYCIPFPSCTYLKMGMSPTVASCFESLGRGDAVSALAQCSTTTDIQTLDHLVKFCTTEIPMSCEYWAARCNSNPTCKACLAEFNNDFSTDSILRSLSSRNCPPLSQPMNYNLLVMYVTQCPISMISICEKSTFSCVVGAPTCFSCFQGTAPANETAECHTLLYTSQGFNLHETCKPCPDTVFEINRIVLATSIIGGVSVVACLAILVAIVAYGRDQLFARDRIVLGLMVSNAIYSSANTMPLNQLRTTSAACGQLALPFDTIQFGRSWWFLGKYSLVCFEMLILVLSIYALQTGTRTLRSRHEAILHILCIAGGFAAFAAFFIECGVIINSGYNEETQVAAQSPFTMSHASEDDDANDRFPGASAAERFDSARTKFDKLEQRMLQAWVGLLGISIALWLAMRVKFATLVSEWKRTKATSETAWADACVSKYDRDLLQVKHRVLDLMKVGYEEIARPLEPFVAVFVVFGVPAIVMASDYCQDHSDASSASTVKAFSSTTVTFGTCNVWCDRLTRRVAGWFWLSSNSSKVKFKKTGLEEVLVEQESDDDQEDEADATESVSDRTNYAGAAEWPRSTQSTTPF